MINTDRSHYIQQFVDSLKDDELAPLYNQIGHRLNLIIKAHELYAMKEFNILDRVYFHHGNQHIEGTVVRINQRTLSVMTADSARWTVTPQHLKKVPVNYTASRQSNEQAKKAPKFIRNKSKKKKRKNKKR